ncbi:MAG: sulfur carrier protein ThiS [candidate division NC10 bacterium]
MEITVNGKAMEVEEGITIEQLLRQLNVRMEFTAVSLNREIARRATFGSTRLRAGDWVEIVRPVGGG